MKKTGIERRKISTRNMTEFVLHVFISTIIIITKFNEVFSGWKTTMQYNKIY